MTVKTQQLPYLIIESILISPQSAKCYEILVLIEICSKVMLQGPDVKYNSKKTFSKKEGAPKKSICIYYHDGHNLQ